MWCAAALVTSTRAYVPGRIGDGGTKCTSLFWRVRPVVTEGSRLLGPSTTTSSSRPTRAAWRGKGGALDDDPQPFEPLGAHLRCDEPIGHGRGLGAGTGREDEGVRAVVLRLGDDLEGPLEVVVGLAWEAHDQVGGYREVVDCCPSRRETLEVARRRVPAVHCRERAITSRLQREMQVLTHGGGRGHRLDRVGPQVLRVGAREPHPADALDAPDCPQQLGEERPHRVGSPRPAGREREVAPVGVDVLPEERDLTDAVSRERLDLGHEHIERPADLGAADRGHDAEGARIVASDLNRHPRAVALLSLRRERGWEGRGVVGRRRLEHLDDGPLFAGELDEVGGAVHVVRAEDDVDPRGFAPDRVALVLGKAPAHHDLHARPPIFHRLQHTEVAVELVVGVLSDAAAVEHHDIGVLCIGSRDEAIGLEQPGDAFGIVLVHLAPEGADEVRAGHPLRLGAAQPAATAPWGGRGAPASP